MEAEVHPIFPCPTELETLFFRVAQEAIRNVVAHAAADRVSHPVAGDTGRALRVVEDGRGFDRTLARRGRALGLPMLGDLAESAGGSAG